MILTFVRGRIKVTSTIALHLTSNISETVRNRALVPIKEPSVGNELRGIEWSRDR